MALCCLKKKANYLRTNDEQNYIKRQPILKPGSTCPTIGTNLKLAKKLPHAAVLQFEIATFLLFTVSANLLMLLSFEIDAEDQSKHFYLFKRNLRFTNETAKALFAIFEI